MSQTAVPGPLDKGICRKQAPLSTGSFLEAGLCLSEKQGMKQPEVAAGNRALLSPLPG